MNKRDNGRKRQKRSKGQAPKGQWKLYLMMSMCVGVLVTGFFFAARQHFSSIDYGIRNSRLRKQLDDLESEKRRLLLAREISVSPAEIKKAAKKFGIGETSTDNVQLASSAKLEKQVRTTIDGAEKTTSSQDSKYLVVKTAMSSEISKVSKPERPKKESGDRPRQVVTSAVASR